MVTCALVPARPATLPTLTRTLRRSIGARGPNDVHDDTAPASTFPDSGLTVFDTVAAPRGAGAARGRSGSAAASTEPAGRDSWTGSAGAPPYAAATAKTDTAQILPQRR